MFLIAPLIFSYLISSIYLAGLLLVGCATVLSVLFFLQVKIIESDKQTAKNTKRIKIDRPQTRLSVVNVESSSIHKANYLHIQMLRYLNPKYIALMIHFTALHVQYKLQLLSKTCGTPRDGNLPTLHFVFEVICIFSKTNPKLPFFIFWLSYDEE